MEDFARALADFVRDHQAWAAPIVLVLAFGELLAFISLLIPAWGALVAIGALIGASGISFWPVWIAGGFGAALGDWVSYWFGFKYKEHVAQMWPLSRYPEILPRGEAFVKDWGVPSIFIGRFFGPLRASVPLAAGIFEMPYWQLSDRQFRVGAGLVGGALAVRRRASRKSPNGCGARFDPARNKRCALGLAPSKLMRHSHKTLVQFILITEAGKREIPRRNHRLTGRTSAWN